MSTTTSTRKLADKWAGHECEIIDSKTGLEYKARIMGRLNDFATVGAINELNVKCEYSWHTVDHVMNENEGRFIL